jgi:DNA-binding protein HU-beta
VNRSQLLNAYADSLSGATGETVSRRQADEALTALTDLITATVASGEDVAISGFAKFRRIDRPARDARNPATGETVRVKAKRVARITPLKAFKDAVLSGKAPRPAAKKKAAAKKTTKKATKKAPARKAPARKAPARKAAKKTATKKRATKRR